MNKACFLPLVLATAVASATFADTYTDQYTNVFTGVTAVSPAGVPSATGGSWTTEGVVLTNVDNKVEFDAEGEAVLRLSVTSAPQDTNTIFRVAVNGTIEDVGELTALDSGAQTAFAICTNSFHAWNGSAWVVLNEVPDGFDGSAPTNLLVEISYQGTNSVRKARFTVGNTTLSLRGTETYWIDLVTSANNLAGFGVNGSGTLAAVNGDVMLGVAEYDGVKYGTLQEAVDVAAADTTKTVDVLRETAETVTVTNSVKIADNGNVTGQINADSSIPIEIQPTVAEMTATDAGIGGGASGSYEIPVNISGGTLSVALPMSNKEIAGGLTQEGNKIRFTIRTATSILEGAMPDGSKALTVNDNLREFLGRNASEAYNAADVTSKSIEDALKTTGENAIPLYQSYALGIEPNVSVKPVTKPNPTSAEQTAGITLYIPNLVGKAGSGDYTIKYKVGDSEQAGGAGSITIPTTGTGSYEVKIVFQ